MKQKILIIEDNTDVRENIAEILQLSGYETMTAENGKMGINCISTFSPDLILCDIMMPELDGYGVLKILNTNPKWAVIPFIFLTAKAEKTDWRKGMSLGASDYITKPFDDVDLLESIQIRLKHKKNESTLEPKKHISSDSVGISYFNEVLKNIAGELEERLYKKKDSIFEEGKNVRNIYFLNQGKIRLYRINEMGKEFTTRIIVKDEAFGFLDALNNRTYTKSAQALEESKIVAISIEKFFNLLNNNLEFNLSLIKHLASYATVTENSTVHQAYSSVRKKVANALLMCYEKNEGNPVLHYQREELASIAGTAKETLIRTLSDFKLEKTIESEGSEIILKNLNALTNMPQ